MTTTLPPARPDAYGTDPGDPVRARRIGGVGELLDPEDVTRFVQEAFSTADLDVRAVNLNYLDPASVDVAAYEADPDTFVVPHAGEVLYRLRPGQRAGSPGEADGRGPSTGWDG
jgi:hypothetical protein